MYIKYRNKPKIIDLRSAGKELSLTPEIVKEKIYYDNQGNVDNHIYGIKFFCPVNIRHWFENAGSKIELKISNLSADDYRQLAGENLLSLLEERVRSGELSEAQAEKISEHQLNKSTKVNQSIAMLSSFYNLIIYQDLFKDAMTITSFDFSKFESRFLNLDSEKFISYKKNRNILERNVDAENKIEKLQDTFRKKHNYLINQGIDPMFLFENSYKKTSTLLNKGGLKIKEPLKLNGYEKFLKEIFEDITNKIQKNSSNNKNSFKIKKRIKEIENISATVELSKNNLEKFGDDIHLIYIVKNEDGINLQVESVPVNINTIYLMQDTDSTNYQINASRNKYSKVSKLAIGSSDDKGCSISLYAKKVENNNILNSKFNLIDENIEISPRQKIYLYDGKTNTNTTPSQFGITKDVIYRSTLNFKNESYDNAKTAFSKGIKSLDDVYPTGNIVALSKNGKIDIVVKNISDNIKSIRIVKKRYKGNSFQKYFEFITDNVGNKISEFKIIEGSEKEFKFEDYDVFDGRIYKYQIQATLKNGENKLVSSNNCIEIYERPQEIIKIDNLRYRKFAIRNDNSGINVDDVDNITIYFNIRRQSPEFESIISEIFGKSSEKYFEQELKDLRSIESFFYSIKIEKINASTGEKTNLENIQINTAEGDTLNQRFSFSDEVKKNEKYFYKLTPRVKPTADLIAIISELSEGLAQNNRVKAVNYASLSSENSRNKLANLIASRITNKYYLKNALNRGLIIPGEIISAQQNNDIFFDASTGDIAYVTVEPIINIDDGENVQLTYVSSKEVKNISRLENSTNKSSDKHVKKYYSLNFSANQNDYFIDYYIVFIKEENNVYLDGVIHSRDSYEKKNMYKYLVEHIGSKGIVDYYIVPVTKQGLILEPKLIYKKLIR